MVRLSPLRITHFQQNRFSSSQAVGFQCILQLWWGERNNKLLIFLFTTLKWMLVFYCSWSCWWQDMEFPAFIAQMNSSRLLDCAFWLSSEKVTWLIWFLKWNLGGSTTSGSSFNLNFICKEIETKREAAFSERTKEKSRIVSQEI